MEDSKISVKHQVWGFFKSEQRNLQIASNNVHFKKTRHQIEKKYLGLKIRTLLKISGKDNSYQKHLIGVFWLMFILQFMLLNSLPYLFKGPQFFCYTRGRHQSLEISKVFDEDQPGETFKCTKEVACSSQHGYKARFLIKNIVSEFGKECEDNWTSSRQLSQFLSKFMNIYWSYFVLPDNRTKILDTGESDSDFTSKTQHLDVLSNPHQNNEPQSNDVSFNFGNFKWREIWQWVKKYFSEMSGDAFIVLISGITFCFLVLIVDDVGRKQGLIIFMVLQSVGLALAILSTTYVQSLVGLSLIFTSTICWVIASAVYLNENIGGKMRVRALIILFLTLPISLWALSGVLYLFADFRLFFTLSFGSLVASLFLMTFLRRSPFFVYKDGDILDLYCLFKDIINFNFQGDDRTLRNELLFHFLFDVFFEVKFSQKMAFLFEKEYSEFQSRDEEHLTVLISGAMTQSGFKSRPDSHQSLPRPEISYPDIDSQIDTMTLKDRNDKGNIFILWLDCLLGNIKI